MTDATQLVADGTDPYQLLPGLSSEEYESLKADIAANGLREPIVLRAGTGEIVDGHHRVRICAEIGVDPDVLEIEFDSDAEAQAYALRVNTNRRQMSSQQWRTVREEQRRVYWELRAMPGWTQGLAAGRVGIPEGTAAWWESEARKEAAANSPDLGTNLGSKNGTQELTDTAQEPAEKPEVEPPYTPPRPIDNRVRLSTDEKRHIYELVAEHGRTHQQVADDYKVSREAITKTMRQEKDRHRQAALHEELKRAAVPKVLGDYHTIVIDPPWPVKKIERDVRPNQSEHLDYPTLDIWCQNPDYSVIDEHEPDPMPCVMPDDEAWLEEPEPCDSIQCVVNSVLGRVEATDSHLYLWTTHKFLPEALKLVESWDYRYQCLMTWRKNVGITPFSWMYDTEHVLFCRRGSLDIERKGLRLSFDAPVTKHSAKPDVFYERVLEASPGPRLELFSRTPREGFHAWGNEANNAE